MIEKILLVDDDPHVLSAYRRTLRKDFTIEVSPSGAEALRVISDQKPFAIVVSDMQMPHMNGIEFLARVKNKSPKSVRIMLTGNADLQTSIDAVNEGEIFRFLTKPCPPEKLIQSMNAGIEQFRLIMAEKELLEQTLSGSISLLTDVLSMINPTAFSRGSRIARYVEYTAMEMGLKNIWQYRLAALLSQIGCVTVPSEILNKVASDELLTKEEQALYNSYPQESYRLLEKIPRMVPIAKMVSGQLDPDFTLQYKSRNIRTGANLLKITLDYDHLVRSKKSHIKVMEEMSKRKTLYPGELFKALCNIGARLNHVKEEISLDELQTGMIIDKDICTKDGQTLVPRGQEVTPAMKARLINFRKTVEIVEPIRIIKDEYL